MDEGVLIASNNPVILENFEKDLWGVEGNRSTLYEFTLYGVGWAVKLTP